jgi:hypothetical protein
LPVKTKGWDERRKKRQAANARRRRPWRASTGPKTPDGKARASQNNLKHGFQGKAGDAFRRALLVHAEFIKKL